MARGVDTGNHPNRQVGPHLSPHWRTTTSITGPMGAATHLMDPNDAGTSLEAWSGPQGHHAVVEQQIEESYGRGAAGLATNRYVGGPYRTGFRAQIAAQALGNRVEAGVGHDQYQAGSWSESRRRY